MSAMSLGAIGLGTFSQGSLLVPELVCFPDSWDNPDIDNETETIFMIIVDGVHCSIEEPTHKDFSNNNKFYSHKFHAAGLDYELGISICTQNCVWVAGPHLAGTPDITIFWAGLKQ